VDGIFVRYGTALRTRQKALKSLAELLEDRHLLAAHLCAWLFYTLTPQSLANQMPPGSISKSTPVDTIMQCQPGCSALTWVPAQSLLPSWLG